MAAFKRTYGVHLLETITKGMYSQPFHCIREYVQNSYDSIREARRSGILKATEGKVVLVVDKENQSLRIRDNGTGLSPEIAAVQLGDLGNSRKAQSSESAEKNAGFRGIGRMAGISYCKTLRFTTSNGQGMKWELRLNAQRINELTRVGQKPVEMEQALDEVTEARQGDEIKGERYFEVLMEGITEGNSLFLDEKQLGDYLAQVAPVHHDRRMWSFEDKITALARAAGHPRSLEAIDIEIHDARGTVLREVRRPFEDTFAFSGRGKQAHEIRVKGIEPLPSGERTATGWWGWIAIHDRPAGFADIPYAGLRFRMHNIEIGELENIRKLFKTQNLAAWCFGEIHITSEGITPNAQRSEFEQSENWDNIQKELQEEIIQIERSIRKESQERNSSTDKLVKDVNRVTEEIDNAVTKKIKSNADKGKLIDKAQKIKEKVRKSINKQNLPESEKNRIKTAEEALKNAEIRLQIAKPVSDDMPKQPNRDTSDVITAILKILETELTQKQYTHIKKLIDKELQQKRMD